MRLRYLRKDLRRNKAAAALFAFVMLAALLACGAVNIASTLLGSIGSFFELSEPPHFLQMHAGGIDRGAIRRFAENNALVSGWLICEALVADGSAMHWNGGAAADTASVMENYSVEQDANFDYMLNLRNERIEVSAGEIAVPIYYLEQQSLKIGDSVAIRNSAGEMAFRIADFVRDAQMNPSIVSSKRFVVSGQDFAALRPIIGETEYSIEFRLADACKLGEFAAAYLGAGLPNTGPAVDIALLRLLNALTDGITAAIVFFAGLMLAAIAFLCLRFAILAALECDYMEIGVMKAIGIGQNNIRNIYLAKYVALAAIGCLCGCILSFPASRLFTANIALYIGESQNGAWQSLPPLLAAGLLFLAAVLFCSLVLRKARRVSAAEALRAGQAGGAGGAGSCAKRLKVSQSRLPVNIYLGLKDICGRPKTYLLLLLVFVAASFLAIAPINLYTTLSAPSFVAYMGIGECDIRLDMQQSENAEERFGEVREALANDADIRRFSSFAAYRCEAIGNGGAAAGIYVETGDYSVFPLEYADGRAPIGSGDIALSALSARSLEKGVGDAGAVTLAALAGTAPAGKQSIAKTAARQGDGL
ncbi:MAG: ABC transporter permease [Clostridiales bacterium]|jgi:putative ABC transport system permease protein|nr:ABC transporter permease [Clostridiales bacterium]